jgi:hypothetical protein
MTEGKQPEEPKLSDLEISILLIRRNVCLYEKEQIDELLDKIGQAKSCEDSVGRESNKENRRPANEKEAGWIFVDTKGAEALKATLKTKDTVRIGLFDYKLTGKGIARVSRTSLFFHAFSLTKFLEMNSWFFPFFARGKRC